jgi:hypothetical protein
LPDGHKNFAYSTVATAPSPATSGTSLVVAAGEGALFPAVPFNATVWPTETNPTAANAEVVRVTVVSTDTFTITRTQEGSSARAVVVGDQIAATVTTKTLTDLEADLWTQVIKALDESVSSSAVLQNDDELFFTATSGAIYEIEAVLVYGSPVGAGTPDVKFAFGEDSTATRGTMSLIASLGTAEANQGTTITPIATNQTGVFGAGTAATNRAQVVKGFHIGAGGTFRVLWAQNTSDANATIVRAGSVLRYRRIV